MDIGWPQLILLSLWLSGLVVHIVKHGQPVAYANGPSKYNGPAKAIALSVWVFLLYLGGFFT